MVGTNTLSDDGFTLTEIVSDLPADSPSTSYAIGLAVSIRKFFRLLKRYPFPRRALSLTFVHAVLDGRDIAGNYYEDEWRHIGYPEDLTK